MKVVILTGGKRARLTEARVILLHIMSATPQGSRPHHLLWLQEPQLSGAGPKRPAT